MPDTKGQQKARKRPRSAQAGQLAVPAGLPPYPDRWRFLEAYKLSGNISAASDATGISRQSHYRWLKDPGPQGDEYRRAFADAHEEAIQRMEAEARRRATEGEVEVVTSNGRPVMVALTADGRVVPDGDPEAVEGTRQVLMRRKRSDALIMFMLKAARPDTYRDRLSHEVGGIPGGAPVRIAATAAGDDEQDIDVDDYEDSFWDVVEVASRAFYPGQVPEDDPSEPVHSTAAPSDDGEDRSDP